jgi:pyruvate dehydrogenase E1 component alpha subunit
MTRVTLSRALNEGLRRALEADELAAKLRAACLALPDPPPLALFDHVYADRSAILDAERAQFAAYLAGFEEEGAEQ